MEPIHAVAALYSKTSLHKVAYSALPDAPVLPYVAPRRRIRRLVAAIHRPVSPADGRREADPLQHRMLTGPS